MDLIAIDIGNSTISLGLFTDDELSRTEHIDCSDAAGLTQQLQTYRDLCPRDPDQPQTIPVVAASVNPDALKLIEGAVSNTFDQRTLLIGRDVPLAMKVAVEDPNAVGSDRLLAASAAYDMLNDALVVADFGTAITVDCVKENGIFCGGAIMPGLDTAALALHDRTAALPHVKLEIPPGDFGVSAVTAIQHGIYYGAIGALRGLVERYAIILNRWPHVILTGGHAELIAPNCDFADSIVPHLCLTGIYLAYVKFRTAQEAEFEGTA